ncbi:MAG: Amuc_1100 family pilus-like protein [Akkermansiaceae bacterium]
MDWIRENKFISGLLGVTLLFVGGIFYYGYSEGDDFKANMKKFTGLKDQHRSLVTAKPYPNVANLKAREQSIEEYESAIDEVRNAFFEYQPEQMPKLTPGEFTDAMIKMQSDLRRAYQDAGTSLPEKFGFGFETYAKKQAAPYATAKLNYQLGAIQWLLEKLAENKPKSLINVRREFIDVERGLPAAPSKKSRRGRQSPNPEDLELFEAMPMEITFTAGESSVRNFLREMANSKQYLYAIRAIRIRNEKQNAPSAKDAAFPARQEPANEPIVGAFEQDNVFGDVGFAIPEGDGVLEEAGQVELQPETRADPESNDEYILKQVLGDENLNVHIRFDILFFKAKREIEKKDAAASPAGN